MNEDPYTGAPLEDPADLAELLDEGFYEENWEDENFSAVIDDEILFDVVENINGSASLLEIASRLHDLADELLELSENGWEIVDDVIDGQATIIHFDTGEVVE